MKKPTRAGSGLTGRSSTSTLRPRWGSSRLSTTSKEPYSSRVLLSPLWHRQRMSRKHKKRRQELQASPQPSSPVPQDQIRFVTRVQGVSFQGPLPPPEILRQYGEVVPNGAERIMSMAERNQEHRHGLEKEVITKGVRNESRGQWLGFILFILLIAAGTYLLATGKRIEGLSTLVLNATTFAALFVYSRRAKEREVQRKRESS